MPVTSTSYQRDPLSVAYDGPAGRLLGRAIGRPGSWVYVAVPQPGGRVRAWLARIGFELKDAGGLTGWERAFQRSAYWNAKQLGISITWPQGDAAWCLQTRWGPRTEAGRVFAVRLSDPAIARRAMKRRPRSERWAVKGDPGGLQSGGIGSPKRRFG